MELPQIGTASAILSISVATATEVKALKLNQSWRSRTLSGSARRSVCPCGRSPKAHCVLDLAMERRKMPWGTGVGAWVEEGRELLLRRVGWGKATSYGGFLRRSALGKVGSVRWFPGCFCCSIAGVSIWAEVNETERNRAGPCNCLFSWFPFTDSYTNTLIGMLYFVAIPICAGKEAVQRLVRAGSACVAARAFLSATARHLISTPDQAFSLRGSKETREDGEVSYNDLVWRYLELGVRGRACVFALRLAAQELAGGLGHRSSSNNKKGGVVRDDEGADVDAAAARLEEGLNVGENTITRANEGRGYTRRIYSVRSNNAWS